MKKHILMMRVVNSDGIYKYAHDFYRKLNNWYNFHVRLSPVPYG